VSPATTASPIVLVVDDDAEVRDALARLLRLHGLDVRAYASGDAFLAADPPVAAACLVVDARMRGADGLAVLTDCRLRCPSAHAILITAWPDDEVARAMVRAGVGAVLRKPFDVEALLALVRTAVAEAPPR
jgi:two-component system response regulator FixJ